MRSSQRKDTKSKAYLEDTTDTKAACDTAVHQAVTVEPRTTPLGIQLASVKMLVSSFILSVNDAGEERRDETYSRE